MLTANENHGFQLTFANGWTVSVQWGMGNYCENKNLHRSLDIPSPDSCANAEVAAWDCNGVWFNFGYDTVNGWQSPDEVAAFVAQVAAFPASVPSPV